MKKIAFVIARWWVALTKKIRRICSRKVVAFSAETNAVSSEPYWRHVLPITTMNMLRFLMRPTPRHLPRTPCPTLAIFLRPCLLPKFLRLCCLARINFL